MKAADISDERVFAVVDAAKKAGAYWATVQQVCEAIPEFPYKIVHAKIRQMIYKKRLDGCPCGCRGDLDRPKATNAR